MWIWDDGIETQHAIYESQLREEHWQYTQSVDRAFEWLSFDFDLDAFLNPLWELGFDKHVESSVAGMNHRQVELQGGVFFDTRGIWCKSNATAGLSVLLTDSRSRSLRHARRL